MTTQAVEERTLDTLVGPLAQTFPQLVRNTILYSDQLTTERRINPELRNQWFYTADSSLYTVERERRKDEVFLYLGRGETNPIFNNIAEATRQLITIGNYIPPKADIEAVVKAESTLRVKLSDLKLQGNESEWRYFEIKTADYDKLNSEQRRVAERVYGQGDDFVENMKMFNQDGISTTRVYVLNPDYVKRNVPQDGALARASRLDLFDFVSWFDAVGGDVGFHFGLRGVPIKVAEGDAPEINYGSIIQILNTPGFDPSQLSRVLNPEAAKILTGALGTYNSLQKQ